MKRRLLDPQGSSHSLLDCGHPSPPEAGSADEGFDCAACDRREIPAAATIGRQTPEFTATTVPSGLLSEHRTNAWAQLVVRTGSVVFVEDSGLVVTATPDHTVVIVPGRAHHIEPSDDARFFVQFYDLPLEGLGVPDST